MTRIYPPLPEYTQAVALVAKATAELTQARTARARAKSDDSRSKAERRIKGAKVWYEACRRNLRSVMDVEQQYLDAKFQHREIIFARGIDRTA